MDELKKNYGVLFEPSSVRSYEFDACCGGSAEAEIPEEYEIPISTWSNVKNQYEISACVAFASSLVGECEYYKRNNKKREMSTGYMYGNKKCRNAYMGKGLYMRTAMKGLTEIGFVPSTYFNLIFEMPDMYNFVKDRDDLAEIGKQLKPSTFVELTKYGTRQDRINSIKKALYTYNCPILMSSRNYFPGGSHCVAIYGYTKDNEFLFQNSWGEKYRDNGRSVIPFDSITDAYLLLFDEIPLPFTDVQKTDWFYKAVKNCTFSGIIKGTSDTTFSPNDNIKRCDVSVIISRMLERAEESINSYLKSEIAEGHTTKYVSFDKISDISFNDVPDNEYYSSAIKHIASLGLINGVGDNKFDPDSYMTRAEIAAIAVRVYNYLLKNIDTNVTWVVLGESYGKVNSPINFIDVSDSDWFKKTIDNAVELGLILGNGDNTFSPNANMTRAECVVILERLFSMIDKILEECALKG